MWLPVNRKSRQILVEEIPNVSRFIHFVTNIYQLGVYGKHVETNAVDECSIVSITEQIKTVVSSWNDSHRHDTIELLLCWNDGKTSRFRSQEGQLQSYVQKTMIITIPLRKYISWGAMKYIFFTLYKKKMSKHNRHS